MLQHVLATVPTHSNKGIGVSKGYEEHIGVRDANKPKAPQAWKRLEKTDHVIYVLIGRGHSRNAIVTLFL